MTKTICIVGAGPSGLVAAKTLLHDTPEDSFKVTIFEAQPRIGGLWPTKKNDVGGLVHPLMVTNQSRHTVQFSNFSWPDSVPQFPKAWQVGQYLERYIDEYSGADIRLGYKVVKTDLQDDGSWKVEVESDGRFETATFDYLLVSTGFFGKPIWPDYVPKGADVPIIHSSEYRDLQSLLAKSSRGGGKILIVGGQMSGIETAATIATHLSSATHSPGKKTIQEPESYSIHHIAHRPSWVFPLFTSPKPAASAPPFLPCDLPSYNLANRPHPLTNSQGHISVEAARTLNAICQSTLGTDQGEFSPETKIDNDLLDQQPFVAMSSYYANLVQSGLIKVINGRLLSFDENVATISPSNKKISNIAAIVLATGFDPSPALSFLPPSVLEIISHSAIHVNLPLALAFHGTHHPSLPTLGFVGLYRSPYWGIMEMQARFVARLWTSNTLQSQSAAFCQALAEDDTIARTLALRTDPRVSQFPMGDYSFLMQEFARALDITITPPLGSTPPLATGKSMDILTPARYPSLSAATARNPRAVEHTRANLLATYETALAGLSGGRFVAGAVFRSLLGEWRLDRTLSSRLPSHPSGRFSGTAQFLLREGTGDGISPALVSKANSDSGQGLGLEYLYIEDGTFTAQDNPKLSFRATRRYIWRYDEARDVLSVWFARTDEQDRADYLFHEVEFLPPVEDAEMLVEGQATPLTIGAAIEEKQQAKTKKGWVAKASHLCIDDLYNVHYEFNFNAVNLKEWTLGYAVNGPKKDYTINGVYRR
ncbi:uncharacterized protein F4812DRAFT_114372 [Daldinia caldariorum]|uniref:uncharacterized protein n=1 Tax=Daldinia caldariorum TaxID=326644 RepID=UPI0020084844|nr:uncharacterized protein F4812DRAFT_114372 [Daldinia caldariorum]KAI1465839.1 hypothetical protein F4812DRAFT_114372 [Daldinia caldariorum]